MFDRQDSLRSDYMSDRESTRYGIVQQASIESADSRLCYLTSSEVSGYFAFLFLTQLFNVLSTSFLILIEFLFINLLDIIIIIILISM